MPRHPTVLTIGLDPDTVDFSAPGIPPGTTAEKIRAGLDAAQKAYADQGVDADLLLIKAQTAETEIERQLSGRSYDCVVIGAGIRKPDPNLVLFERVVNAVHRLAPRSPIALDDGPDDSPNAAARRLPKA